MRRRDREVTDPAEIRGILDTADVIRIGMHDGEGIYIVPMNYGYTFAEGKLLFYVHGSLEGKKWDLIRQNGQVAFEIDCDHEAIEGKLPCQYGYAYACMMGNGRAEIVDDPEEKMNGLSILMSCQTGKDFSFNERLVSIVNVMKITADSYTCKRRPRKP